MKRSLIFTLAAATVLSSAAVAAPKKETPAPAPTPSFFDGKFVGSAGFFSNYVFRGISQTNDGPAIQANIDYVFDNGLKLGVWGSNVDFSAANANTEFDFYAAYAHTVGSWTGEVGTIYYYYPSSLDSSNLDYFEVYGALGYDFGFASLTGSLNYSPDYTGSTGDAFYYRLAAKAPLPYNLSLDGWVGYQDIDDNATATLPSYTDWALGLAYTYDESLTFKVQYTDTDIDTVDCAGGLIPAMPKPLRVL